MIDHLMKKFIKEDEDPQEGALRFALLVGLIVHFLMFALKLAIGITAKSVALRADAWNSLAGAAGAALGLADLLFFSRNRLGREKQKGIREAKYILSFITAFIIFEAGFSFFSRAFTRLGRPATARMGLPAVLVLFACMALRRWLSVFFIRIGRKINLRSIPKSMRSAVTANILTFLAVCAALLDQFLHINADFGATLIISVNVIKAAVLIAVYAIRPAIEEEPDQEVVRAVRKRLRQYSLIEGTGSLKTRFFGPGRRMIAMRVKVPKEADPAETYGSIRVMEEKIGKEFGITLILHVDPIESTDREALSVREHLEEYLEEEDQRISFDHFHIVRGTTITNLIFDLFVPFEYEEERTQRLMKGIEEQMNELNPLYQCIIYPRKLT